MQGNKSLEELEKIYSKKKPVISRPDMTYDRLQILDEEFNKPSSSLVPEFPYNDDLMEENTGFELMTLYDKDDLPQKFHQTKDIIIETQSFLATKSENLINTKYESPFKTVKKFLLLWTFLSILSAIVIITYFIIDIWVIAIILKNNSSSLPTVENKLINYYSKTENMIFSDYYANLFISLAGLILIFYSNVILIIENMMTNNWKGPISKEKIKYAYIIFLGVYFFGTLFQIKIYDYERGYEEINSSKIEDNKRNWKYLFDFLVILCFIVKWAFFYGHFFCFRTSEKMKIIKLKMLEEIIDTTKFQNKEQKQPIITDWKLQYINT